MLDDGTLDGEVHLTQIGECVRGELTRALCAQHLKGTQPRRARRDGQRSLKHFEEELECALSEELLLRSDVEGEASEDAEGRAVEGDDLGLSEGDELAAAVACGQLLAVGGVGADEGSEGGARDAGDVERWRGEGGDERRDVSHLRRRERAARQRARGGRRA